MHCYQPISEYWNGMIQKSQPHPFGRLYETLTFTSLWLTHLKGMPSWWSLENVYTGRTLTQMYIFRSCVWVDVGAVRLLMASESAGISTLVDFMNIDNYYGRDATLIPGISKGDCTGSHLIQITGGVVACIKSARVGLLWDANRLGFTSKRAGSAWLRQ